MRFFIELVRTYPRQSIIMLFALLLAGFAEGFGLSAMIPLLSIVAGSQYSGGQIDPGSVAGTDSAAERVVRESLEFVGLTPTVEVLLAVIFCAIILKSVLVLFANKRVGYTVAQVATDLRLELLRALLATRWEFHLRQPVGSLANAMATEAQRACKAYLCGANMIIGLVQAAVYVCVALLVSWKAVLAALVAGLVIFYGLRRLIAKARRAGERQTQLLKSLLAYLTDSLQSIKPLKAMALQHLSESILRKETTKLNEALRKEVLSKEYLRAFQEPLRIAFILLGFYAATILIRLPLTTLMILVFLVARVLNLMSKVQGEYQRMVILESGFWSIKGKILEAEEDREVKSGDQTPNLKKSVHLDQVSFSYGEKSVLQDAELLFPAGKITAIIGPSGSGKTTLVDLVIGLLRPTHGKIWVDDLPLAQIDLQKWRQLIGYVPQETWLLHDSILINITLGDPNLNEDDAIDALRAAGAWEFVQSLPDGINSSVGERGGKVSGGQRQRIAIARALAHRPKLLILDEATTALDPKNELAICETLSQLKGKITILAISHQPAILEIADKAYRLHNGAALSIQVGLNADLQSEKLRAEGNRETQLTSALRKIQ
jgi:ATP-binding cassette subfamily C protein